MYVLKQLDYDIKHLYKFQDVAYKPEELYVHTRKCEPEAGPNVVGGCARQVILPWIWIS